MIHGQLKSTDTIQAQYNSLMDTTSAGEYFRLLMFCTGSGVKDFTMPVSIPPVLTPLVSGLHLNTTMPAFGAMDIIVKSFNGTEFHVSSGVLSHYSEKCKELVSRATQEGAGCCGPPVVEVGQSTFVLWHLICGCYPSTLRPDLANITSSEAREILRWAWYYRIAWSVNAARDSRFMHFVGTHPLQTCLVAAHHL
jgi:hypothetical protein